LAQLLARATVLLLGPGLGQNAWAYHLYDQVLASYLPKVTDADALNLFPKNPVSQNNWILTPHPGEARVFIQLCQVALSGSHIHVLLLFCP
jgi:NAD(P)H-hydrate repair Nnr-like enzyme with NAD(P)H-hydrate dehydratase domain